MKEEYKLQCQCCICKKVITNEESKLDPCSVEIFTNVDKDSLDQKSQTFFCHYDCFRKINNDDSVLYLESLSTEREANEENESIKGCLSNLTDLLYRNAAELGIWDRVFRNPMGKWSLLKSVLGDHPRILESVSKAEERLLEQLVITWMDDYSSEQRSKNRLWKVIIIATEGHYEFPITILIDLNVDSLEVD